MKIIKNIISAVMIICLVFTSISFQTITVFADQNDREIVAEDADIFESNGQTATTFGDVDDAQLAATNFGDVDDAQPALDKAVVNGVILTLNFNKKLDIEKVPSISDFTVKITYNSPAKTDDTSSGSAIYSVSEDTVYTIIEDTADIAEINVYGSKVSITLADAVTSSSAVTLDYAPSGDGDPLQDPSGNTVEGFSDYAVVNITGEVGLPDFVVEKIYSELETSSFSQELAHQVYYVMLDFPGTKDELLTTASDIVGILQSAGTYSGLTDENKSKVCGFFGISDTFLTYSGQRNESMEQSILSHAKMAGYGLTEGEIEQAVQSGAVEEVIKEKVQEFSDQANEAEMIRAATSEDDPFAEAKYAKEKQLSAPFQHNSYANEQIDLSTGILDYNVTDVVLPGAGGLDLVIERQYSSELASYYDVTARLQYATGPSASPKDSKMTVSRRERYFEKNADGTLGERIDTSPYEEILNDFIETGTLRGFYNMKEIEDGGDTFTAYLYKKTMSTAATYMSAWQVSNPITLNDKLWQLGTGWKFNFSYMDIDTFNYGYMKLYLSDGREFGVSPNWVNNLGHYTYKDVIFSWESVTVRGQTSSYSVAYADGKKEYFNSEGRLIAIADRFGNTISFTYTTDNNKLEMQITDTLGRAVTLTNQTTANGYNKVLTLPDGKTITYVITHNTGRTIDNFDYLEDFPGQYNEYNLTKVINQEGEETAYSYTDISCDADFAARFYLEDGDIMHPHAAGEYYYWDYYAGLTKITYPTGLSVNYDYYNKRNAWYDYGCYDDIAIKKRYDQQGSTAYNTKEYDYYNRYVDEDGVLTNGLYNADDYHNESWQNWWVSEKDTGRNITTKYYFDYSYGSLVGENIYLGSDLLQETAMTYRTFNGTRHPSMTRTTINHYDTSNGQPLTTVECFDYDDRGNAVSWWPTLSEGNTADTEFKVSMTYHGTYNYLTGKVYKRDAATTITEQYVPRADGKTVAQALVYENGTLKARDDFAYDSYGNVIESKEYTNPAAGTYSETDSTYTNGTYLTGITVQNVLDADGINTGSVSRQATYDIYGRILTETDGNGNVTAYEYDDLGRITEVTYPGSIMKTYVYNTPANQTTVTDERGFVTRYQYDPAGNLTAVYSMDSGTATLLNASEYDSLYRLIKEQNNLAAGGGSTSYSYDYKDRVTQKSAKNAANQTLSQENYTYFDDKTTKTVEGDDDSEPIVTTEYTDKCGRVTKQGRFINGVEIFNTFTYNYLGEAVKEKSARANTEGFPEEYTAKYEHDFAGNVKKQYDVFNNYVTTVYDATGRKISVTDARSNASGGTYSIIYTYDALGRLIKEETPFTSGSTAVTKYYYDDNDNLIRKQTVNSLPGAAAAYTRTEYEYDDRNRLVHVKSYDGAAVANQVDYEYDAAGNMTAMVTGNGTQRTGYEYDRYGNLVTLTDPMGQDETYAYNINGNMTSKTDKNGLTTGYTYDGLSRKLSQSVNVDGAIHTESYGYTATGGLGYAQNSNISAEYAYDELGRVVTELDTNGVEKNYTYDVNGNLKTSVVKVGGTPVKSMSFIYDKKDRLSQVYEGGALVASYTYDANGNRNSLTYGNGTGTDYAYNLANMVTSLQNKKGAQTLSGYAYTYYLDGNQATKADHTGEQTSYSYDGLSRLTQEAESGASDVTKVYTFDPAGNRATMTVSGAESYTVGYAYDLNNRLTAETKNTAAVTEITDYFYDKNGNTIAKRLGTLTASSGSETPVLSLDMTGAELYSYDGFDRMVRAEDADGVSTYAYRPDGLRLSKTVGGVTTTHVWEGDQITLELDENDAVTNKYIRGINLILSENGTGANKRYFLYNGHGDTIQLTDTSGNVAKSYSYDAFGNERNIDLSDTNPFRYTGEYYDLSSGTYYLRARNYDPTTGRFLSEDTNTGKTTDPLSLNLYTYCENDPVNFIDSTGNSKARALVRGMPDQKPYVSERVQQYYENSRNLALSYGFPEEYADAYASMATGILFGEAAGSVVKSAKVAADAAKGMSRTAQQLSRASVVDKLDRYLLNPEHAVGGSKAKWFNEALGFNKSNMNDLANQIVFNPSKAVQTEVTEFGIKYNQVISITGANGKTIDVTFAWIKNKDGVVRLVTGIPTKK